eukprot:TRINITY_DN4484_c0_g1_i1.p1 TRINITY_DN4484_c0_g1~~TRINITY_DN4484_c0_g1_i1.p1  ORF type:complete len:269 (-),score=43.50 TRINITY_DN4484_c0_g1_i1:89-895(-)
MVDLEGIKEAFGPVKVTVIDALKANALPGLILFLLEAVLIVLYYYCLECSSTFVWIGEIKQQWGYLYSALATSLFGGFLPWVIGLCTNEIPRDNTKLVLATFFFLILDWAIIGVIVDALYRCQAIMFGTGSDAATIIKKVAFDMFVWTPCAGIWITLLPFHWRACEFSCTKFWQTLTKQFLLVTGCVTLCTSWAIWFPSVSVVYSLPSDLQIPVFNFILCFANLILLFLTRGLNKKKEEDEGKVMEDVVVATSEEMTPLVHKETSPNF